MLNIAIQGRTQVYGPADPRPLESLYQIGRMFLKMQDYASREEIYDRRVAPQITTRKSAEQWIRLLSVYTRLKAHQGHPERALELTMLAR